MREKCITYILDARSGHTRAHTYTGVHNTRRKREKKFCTSGVSVSFSQGLRRLSPSLMFTRVAHACVCMRDTRPKGLRREGKKRSNRARRRKRRIPLHARARAKRLDTGERRGREENGDDRKERETEQTSIRSSLTKAQRARRSVREYIHIHIHTYTHIYIYIYIYHVDPPLSCSQRLCIREERKKNNKQGKRQKKIFTSSPVCACLHACTRSFVHDPFVSTSAGIAVGFSRIKTV